MVRSKSRPLLIGTTVLYLLVVLTLGEHADVSNKAINRRLFRSAREAPDANVDFGVLLDAGSTSTKLKVYTVIRNKSPTKLPKIQIIHSEKFSPGLDSFAHDNNTDAIRKYLGDILAAAKKKVPESKQKDTPILLFATAGLRFLDADVTTKLLDNTKALLSDPKISPFKYKSSDVGVLSGEEEGVYAWVALNYLLGFFDNPGPDSESVGILEMGGGSTQIAFIPKGPVYDGEYQVRILKHNHDLYVHSYLQFGTNAISLWIAEILLKKRPNSKNLNNPCMLRGDVAEITQESGQVLKLKGTSKPALCKEILKTTLAPQTGIKCKPKPCAIGTVYQPSVDNNKFYATQAFTYAPVTLKVIDKDEVLHLDRLEQAVVKHCARNLSESSAAGIKEQFGSNTCLMGLYIPTLLTDSYKFPPSTTNIKVTSHIGNDTIDWSLGKMVIELTGNSVRRRR